MEKIVVLLSSYNGEKYIKEQLDSILNQRNVDVVLIIRDDGSKDSTLHILEDYKTHNSSIEILEGANCGSTKSFSILLEYAYSKYGTNTIYAFSDQDDVWKEDKLFKASLHIDRLSKKPMLYCSNLQCVNESLASLGYMRGYLKEFTKSSTLIEPIATGCTMVFNPKAVEQYIKYYSDEVRMHDIWMSQICVFLGTVYYDNESYILYRQHGSNQIGNKSGIIEQMKEKYKSLITIFDQHYRERDSLTFLKACATELSTLDFELVNTVANYRLSFNGRIKLIKALFSGKIKRYYSCNIWLFIRIILGVV